MELVSGMDCKVFGANNVEIVTKTRTEHMSAEDKHGDNPNEIETKEEKEAKQEKK